MRVTYLLLILMLFAISACSQANSVGTQREYNIKISNQGTLFMYTPLEVTAQTDQKQDINNDPTTSTDANASLAGKGATSSLATGAAKQLLDGVNSLSKDILDRRDQSTNTTETTTNVTEKKEAVSKNHSAEENNKVEKEKAEESKEGEESGGGNTTGFDISSVKWLHTDVSKWPVTSTLKSVGKVGNNLFRLDYDKADVWPGVGSKNINANPWVLIKKDGKWYAATWEWLRKGQTVKSLQAVDGSHIKRDPLKEWHPKVGEKYGFMVSGLARDMAHFKNVQERTNILWYTWR